MHCKNTWVYLVILTKCVKTVNLFARVMFILSGRQTPKRQYSIVPLLGLWFTNVYNITMYYNGTNGTNLYTTSLYIYWYCMLYTVYCITLYTWSKHSGSTFGDPTMETFQGPDISGHLFSSSLFGFPLFSHGVYLF